MSFPQKPDTVITYFVTNKGLLVSFNVSYYNHPTLSRRVNGKHLEPTFNPKWFFVEGEKEVLSYEKKQPDKTFVVRYDLNDAQMEVDGKIPASLSVEDVGEYYDESMEETVWGNYNALKGLYHAVVETLEGGWENEEFVANKVGDVIGDVSAPIDTAFRMNAGKDIKPTKISQIAHYSELDTILTPEFAIHKKPCSLTSKQTYDIVRTWIKDNIDPKQAVITSDYDFCFTVKKKVAVKPWVKTVEELKANGKSYKTPKYKKHTVTHKEVEIFEMTHGEKGYQNYTIIEGFTGESLEDLVDNMKIYLQSLIDTINEPVKECECCGGTGHLFPAVADMNLRQEVV